MRRPPTPPLFPYTTLFRSLPARRQDLRGSLSLARTANGLLNAGLAGGRDGGGGGDRRAGGAGPRSGRGPDRKSTRLNSSHSSISYAVFCLKKKKTTPG